VPASSLIEEAAAIAEATGSRPPLYGAVVLATFRGLGLESAELIETSTRDLVCRGERVGLTFVQWASAVLNNGLGRYEDALAAAQRAVDDPYDLLFSTWAMPELVEAGARSDSRDVAAAFERLSDGARASGTDWALGIEAQSRALLSEGQAADAMYRDAVERLGRTRIRWTLARAHLLYGEWLRRERRRADAREQLRTAHEMFVTMGAEAFAGSAERELLAAGGAVRKRTLATDSRLTAQEAQVARLARDGLSNPEIGARLFISPRTVEYHLRKVFTKLGIQSRTQLDRVLPAA
jgi:DNA-binding CsgD family transcriptional regulator